MKILKRRLPSLRHSWYYQIMVILFSPCGFLAPKDLKLTFFIFEFQIFGFWAYLMTAIPETRYVCTLRFYYHTIDIQQV
jgi:hypothetical protein